MRAFLVSMGSLVILVAFLYAFSGAIQNPVYQNGLTARFDALQQTKRVQAQEFGDTMRTWGMWGGGGLAVVGGLVAIGWAVNRWQEQRTKRHETTEEQMTERLRITTKKDVALAWIAQFGVPDRDRIGTHGGQLGVFTVEDGADTFVPLDVCRAELAANQGTALARRTPQTINVPPVQQERRFLVVGEMEQEDW